jgi:hypothetical protein
MMPAGFLVSHHAFKLDGLPSILGSSLSNSKSAVTNPVDMLQNDFSLHGIRITMSG